MARAVRVTSGKATSVRATSVKAIAGRVTEGKAIEDKAVTPARAVAPTAFARQQRLADAVRDVGGMAKRAGKKMVLPAKMARAHRKRSK
jgi:hypothetical protein